MRQSSVITAATVLSVVLVSPGSAQEPMLPPLDATSPFEAYVHRTWNTDSGLPQNSITSIAQTPDGYLWFGTNGGLVRFDGVTFRVYDVSTSSVPTNWITRLEVAPDGTLWVGTDAGVVRHRDGELKIYPGTRVTGLSVNGDEVWVAAFDGLFRVGEDALEAVTFPGETELQGRLVSVQVDKVGEIWVSTEEGVFRTNSGRLDRLTPEEACGPERCRLWRSWLFKDPSGDLLIATLDQILLYDGSAFTAVAPAAAAVTVLRDRAGTLWFSDGNGLGRQVDGELSRMDRAAIGSRSTRTLFVDREGSLWIGTEGAGLHQLRDGTVRGIGEAEGLPIGGYVPIIEDPDGGVWMGARCGALARYDEGTFSVVDDSNRPGPPCFNAMLVDRDGLLWIANGGHLSTLEDGIWTSHATAQPGELILSIHQDDSGRIWVGGDALYELVGNELQVRARDFGLHVRGIAEDAEGGLWMTTDEGVSRYSAAGVETVPLITGGGARDVYIDAEGVVWVGTYGAGLARLSGGEPLMITEDEGLCDNVVSRIIKDDDGFLWMNGNRGISRVSLASLNAFAEGSGPRIHCMLYGKADGARMSEGNGGGMPAGIRTSGNELWFPTIEGVSIIDLDEAHLNTLSPLLTIEGLLTPEGPLPASPGVRLAAGTRDLEILYASPSFRAPERVRFSYMLEGYDSDWIDAGDRRRAFYTNLGPGAYTFRVRAMNEDGVWTPDATELAFSVAPFLYQTNGAKALYLLMVLGMAVGLHRIRTHRLKARAHLLEAQVNERTTELRRSKEAAEEQNLELQEALANIKTLKGLIPICSYCKSIRDDEGYWQKVELYVRERSDAEFSHGICPDCMKSNHPHEV